MAAKWLAQTRQQILDTPVFAVEKKLCYQKNLPKRKQEMRSGSSSAHFYTICSQDWTQCIPIYRSKGILNVICVSQFRHGTQNMVLEFPGGIIDKGEKPETAARRELQEETGYIAKKITALGTFYANPAIMNNSCHIFLAENLSDMGEKILDAHEDTQVQIFSLKTLLHEREKLQFKHGLMLAGIFLLLEHLRKQGDYQC